MKLYQYTLFLLLLYQQGAEVNKLRNGHICYVLACLLSADSDSDSTERSGSTFCTGVAERSVWGKVPRNDPYCRNYPSEQPVGVRQPLDTPVRPCVVCVPCNGGQPCIVMEARGTLFNFML
jgi:hypothetical protein